ncbi:MAG: tRNA-specific adenosine deaminase [Bacteroidetes bacterium]|jgi:tRNA(Arg) A34 adenosine deaminase TadA|nr:tRNA-specific adenosine deaminase [Bacteroidota bacterium]
METKFLDRAIELAEFGMEQNHGGPFGCVIVKNGVIIAEGHNRVTSDNDPTAHAEIVAIRKACDELNDFQLTDCDIYTSCEPCPMCIGAIYWARPNKVIYAATREDAAEAGFDDHFIYEELNVPPGDRNISMKSAERKKAVRVFEKWIKKEDKIDY